MFDASSFDAINEFFFLVNPSKCEFPNTPLSSILRFFVHNTRIEKLDRTKFLTTAANAQ
jgi:hypothetical protein